MTLVENPDYVWGDQQWMEARGGRSQPDKPITIYQVHLASWMRVPEQNNRPLTPVEIAPKLAAYVSRLNFTHVELLYVQDQPSFRQPVELMQLIDHLHHHDIGVILNGLPPQLPTQSAAEARALTTSYLDRYHADWLHPDASEAMTCAGSGFRLRRDLRWERDTLDYFSTDPIRRKYHHHLLTSRSDYAFSDNFVLALSHEEVAPGKTSLLTRMPGDDWRRFANLRLLYACMFGQPGKKLLFMGNEFGQWREWRPEDSLDWHLVRENSRHAGLQQWVADVNRCYRDQRALHQSDGNADGFEWCNRSDAEWSTVSWLRRSLSTGETILVVLNCTPVPRSNYRVGVPGGGIWTEILNSDAREYGGSGQGNMGAVETAPFGWDFKSHSLSITLPPLGAVFLKQEI
jgi:1,4-alpha-glucan branching enzyme